MKIRKTIVALLPALALLFPSCQETEIDYVKPEKLGNVYATVPAPVNYDPETKGISIDADNHAVFKWIKDVDNINVFSSKKGESMIYSIKEVSSEDPTHCSFLVEDFALKTGNTYYGFYPSANSNDPSKVIIDYSTQRQYALDDDSHLSAYSYMVTAPVEASESGAGFAFSHKSGWLTFKILAKDDFIAEKIVVSTNTADAFIVKGTMDVVSQNITTTKSASQVVLYLGEPEEGIEIKGGVPTRAFMALNDVKPLNNVKAVLSGHDMNGNAVEIVKEIVGERFYENGTASSITLKEEGAVIYQAKIGDTYYATFEDAIKAALEANDGVPVELLGDITYAEGTAWTPIVFNGGTVVIDGKGYTVKGLPGMLFDKQGSGGHHLRMSSITFDGAKVNDETGNAAVIVGYADSMNELKFENVTIKNSTVIGTNYAAAFVGYSAGYSGNDGPVFQEVAFKNCTATDNIITGGGSTGTLMGHAAGNKWAAITVEGTTVENNVVTCTGTSTNKAGSVFGTVGNAGAELGPNGEVAGLFVSATVNGNTVKSGSVDITTIYGRQGSTGGRLVMTEGGSYDARPYNESDSAWASCAAGYTLSEVGGVWTVVKAPSVAKIGDTEYTTLEDAIKAALEANDGVPVELLGDITYAEGTAWTPIVFNGGTVVIDGKGYTVKGLPGMLFDKQGSGGHHLRMSNITFDGAKVSIPDSDYAAVIVGYADAMNELEFNKVSIINSSVSGKKYAAAFVGYAAGYSKRGDGPVFQEVTFADCIAENNTISGGGSTGVLMGHAAGSDWAIITVDGTSVLGNTVTSTGADNNKAGSLFGTAGNAGATPGPDGRPAGLYVTATVSANNVKSAGTTITTICGRQGSTGGRLVMTEGGSYDARPYNESDSAWASCAAGYGLSENDGIWTVVKKEAVAKIGDTSYSSIEEAIAAAVDGQTVTIVSDFAPDATIQVNKKITIDLDGHTIANTADLWVDKNWSVFSVKNGGELTITGEGTINAKEDDCYAFDVCDGGSLTINNGTIIGNISAVYAYEGKVTINGGTFSIKQKDSGSDPNKFLLNCLDANYKNGSSSIVVKGGSFDGFNPSNNAAEGAGTNFCAEGYTAIENDGVWTVKEAEEVIQVSTQDGLIAAIEAAKDGATIKLASGIYTTYGTKCACGKTLKFVGDGEVIWKYGANYTVKGEGASDYSFEGSNVTFKNIVFEDNLAVNDYYRGFVRPASMTFESCTLKNMMGYLGVGDVHFKDCVFDAASICEYDIKLYSGKDFYFDGCTFYGNNKGYIQAYRECDPETIHKVYVKDCKFEAKVATSKTAVYFYDLGANEGARWEIHFDGTNDNVNSGIANSSVSGTWLWGDMKYQTSATAKIYEGSKLVWANNAKVE